MIHRINDGISKPPEAYSGTGGRRGASRSVFCDSTGLFATSGIVFNLGDPTGETLGVELGVTACPLDRQFLLLLTTGAISSSLLPILKKLKLQPLFAIATP
eukprot:CAMPEP_0169147304 /NCGR_PEP_ID=MMETSP1015-20121227/48137_1 /TAXON_ID=342587 /ORGANISM="Karlodinium micrum, Strain CCMP2283" /LENGTH=100 /DNA_ID=CAMNT_0009215479 /DNA_START=133 /DNA_END=431 /DNA_ORIENTATION=-